jgi:hypothetical protein
MFADFLLIDSTKGGSRSIQRLPLGETGGRNEAWLRDALFRYPELLPIGELDPSFGPLLPICCELRTEVGPIDVAYINPMGRLTLVECKLWRNPEARRKVVAQILDYARTLARWSYSDLQRQVTMATGRKGNVAFELAHEACPDLPEHQFVDAVTRNLRAGRFLLIIAGDGIREDVAGITELISRNSALGFSFGLVELALYDLGPDGLLIQPRVPLRSHVVERKVMVLSGGDVLIDAETAKDDLREEISSEASPGASAGSAAQREWWKPVLSMRFDDPDQEAPRYHWPNYVRVRMPLPQVWITGYRNESANGSIGVFLAGRASSLEHAIKLLEPLDDLIPQLPTGAYIGDGRSQNRHSIYTVRSRKSFGSDDECIHWLMDTLNQYVNVFRPRLKHLTDYDPD